MQAIATMIGNQRQTNEQIRARALVRFNALSFHSLAVASFLETAVPPQVIRLDRVYGTHPDIHGWLEQVWWPQRAELGRQLRGYVEATWPEFDWSAAYHEFYDSYRPRSGVECRYGGVAFETLGLCVTSAQAALFYRTLSNSADDPALRALTRAAAEDHSGYFDFFRAQFERRQLDESIGFTATWRTVISTSRCARDHDVAAAFRVLAGNWSGAPVVPCLDYADYRVRMTQAIQRHVALGPVGRLLFRPWLARGRATPAPQMPAAKPNRWMRATPHLT